MTLARSAAFLAVAQLAMFVGARPLHAMGGPDLVLAVVAMVAVGRPQFEAILLAAASGVVADAFSAAAFGTRSLTLVLVAYLVSTVAMNLNAGSLWVRCAVVIGAMMAGSIVEALLRSGGGMTALSWSIPRPTAMLATALVGMMFWPLLTARRADGRT